MTINTLHELSNNLVLEILKFKESEKGLDVNDKKSLIDCLAKLNTLQQTFLKMEVRLEERAKKKSSNSKKSTTAGRSAGPAAST